MYEAWQLLVKAGEVIDPSTMDTLNYDIVNVGREVLAQLITVVITVYTSLDDSYLTMSPSNCARLSYPSTEQMHSVMLPS